MSELPDHETITVNVGLDGSSFQSPAFQEAIYEVCSFFEYKRDMTVKQIKASMQFVIDNYPEVD